MRNHAMLPATLPLQGPLPPVALDELSHALGLLHGGNRLARMAGSVARFAGRTAGPLMRLGAMAGLPTRAADLAGILQPAVEQVLARAFDVAILGLPPGVAPPPPGQAGASQAGASQAGATQAGAGRAGERRAALPRWSGGRARVAVALSGAAGGAAGVAGFLPDATFTTLMILRTIARIASANGEDVTREDTRRACLEIFIFGGAPLDRRDQASALDEGSYWGARLVLQGSPIVKLVAEAAARFGVALSQKLAVQAVPIAGAAGGALVNAAFLDHYRALAEGHFTIRRLERQYSEVAVQEAATTLLTE